MLDIKRIRQDPHGFCSMLISRGMHFSVQELLEKDEQRRLLLKKAETLKETINSSKKRIGAAKKKGASADELASITQEVRRLNEESAVFDLRISELNESIDHTLRSLPNYPDPSVSENTAEIRCWKSPRVFLWAPKSYQEIGSDLHILHFDRTAKTPEIRYSAAFGLGAMLERSLVNLFFLNCCGNGYNEVRLPGSTCQDHESLLLHQETILDKSILPIKHSSYIQHKNCAELSIICEPEASQTGMEELTAFVEEYLQRLALPYRISILGSKEMPDFAAKTYSIEVWMPSIHRYVRFAVCSNCEDYLARASAIRYRASAGEKPQHVHTLHAQLHMEVIAAAILENEQNENGTVTVPTSLRHFMGTETIQL